MAHEEHGQPDEHLHKPRPGFFVQGEIILIVSHPQTSGDWQRFVESLGAASNLRLSLVVPMPSEGEASKASTATVAAFESEYTAPLRPVITIPNQTNDRLQTLIPLKLALPPVSDHPEDEEGSISWQEADSLVLNAISILNHISSLPGSDILLQAAAPNWLFTGSTHVLTGGGPGAVPVPIPTQPLPTQADFSFQRDAINALLQGCSGIKQVDVVILDTAPASTKKGAERWDTVVKERFSAHTKFNAQGVIEKRTIFYAKQLGIQLPPDRVQAPDNYYSNKDHYDIKDHGLFIAGIVADFVPQANIYIVEVLNHEGVGTSYSLAAGLNAIAEGKIADIDKSRALIVNCSLGFPPPQLNAAGKYELVYHEEGTLPFTLQLDSPDLIFKPITDALKLFYESFEGVDVQITASSGNEGDEHLTRPKPAQYPAAFPDVLGVGAVQDANGTRAWYSNLADTPPYNGVVVFGGGAIAKPENHSALDASAKRWAETDLKDGMLGVYIHDFPVISADGEVTGASQSVEGWGRWAGTSFACGVLSGILAYAASKGCDISLKRPNNFYERIHAHPSTKRTPYGEIIISVPQGVQPSIPAVRKSSWQQFLDAIRDFFTRLGEIFKS